MHQYSQTATKLPMALSDSTADIFNAARARAAFWDYYPAGPWGVMVRVPRGAKVKSVSVYCDATGELHLGRNR